MKIICVPETLTQAEFDLVLNETKADALKYYRRINFDFHKTTFVSSFGMTLFILLCEFLIYECNKKILITLSSNENKSRVNTCMFILARLGFFDSLPDEISYYPYKPKRNNNASNAAILEVTKIFKPKAAKKVIDLTEIAIKKNTNYSDEQVNDICLMVSEIIQNIFYHSECKRSALLSIQRYPQLHFVQLVIADSGIGIPETLNKTPEYKSAQLSDSQAILESLKIGVSRFGKEEGRGEGLTKCYNLSRKHLAIMFIRSNSGSYLLNFKKRKAHLDDCQFLSGTQIYVNFPSL